MALKNRKISLFLVSAAALLSAVGCTYGGGGSEPTPGQSQTLIMYMVGRDNGLHSYLKQNVEDVIRAVADHKISESASIYVFFEGNKGAVNGVSMGKSHTPVLYRIDRPSKIHGEVKLDTIQVYSPEDKFVTGQSIEMVIKDVLADEATPADTYGLLISSHGAGWLPEGYKINAPKMAGVGEVSSIKEETGIRKPEGALTRWIGEEVTDGVSSYMNVSDLVTALDAVDVDFDYVLFDACFMSSIEVLYEMRNSVKYVIASPSEIMGAGFPMYTAMPLLLDGGRSVMGRVVAAADDFYRFYLKKYYSSPYDAGAISVVDCSKLDELAEMVRNIYAKSELPVVDIKNVQYLEMTYNHTFHDLEDYLYYLCSRSENELLRAFLRNEVLLYENHTPKLYSALGSRGRFDANHVCGISTFIPDRAGFTATSAAWYDTEWAKAIGAQPN